MFPAFLPACVSAKSLHAKHLPGISACRLHGCLLLSRLGVPHSRGFTGPFGLARLHYDAASYGMMKSEAPNRFLKMAILDLSARA
ncbi:MAG TPA: hypothetical protein VKP61_12295 [Candidatus Acidoferrum sp.]|nr:hypothetical protein [Candidatus Acidoferrum sp.]